MYSSSPYGAAGVVAAAGAGGATFERGKMVFLEDVSCNNDGMRRFELEELLRASAEMLGKRGCGTAYGAMLDDGTMVTVKWLCDATALAAASKKDFEHHMAVLGHSHYCRVEFRLHGCAFTYMTAGWYACPGLMPPSSPSGTPT